MLLFSLRRNIGRVGFIILLYNDLQCIYMPFNALLMHISDNNKERDSVAFYSKYTQCGYNCKWVLTTCSYWMNILDQEARKCKHCGGMCTCSVYPRSSRKGTDVAIPWLAPWCGAHYKKTGPNIFQGHKIFSTKINEFFFL